MYDSISLRAHWKLSLFLVAVLTLLILASSPVSAADPPATLTIEATPTSIDAGDTTEFTVVFTNTSGGPVTDQQLTLKLSGPVKKWNAKMTASTDVRTDNVRRVDNTLHWKGDIKDGGSATFAVRVVSASWVVDFEVINAAIGATSASEMLVLDGQFGPFGESPVAMADETVTVHFPEPVDHDKIEISRVIEYQDGNDLVVAGGPEVPSNQRIDLQLDMFNNSEDPVYSLLVERLQMENTSAASLDSGTATCKFEVSWTGVTPGHGSVVPLRALGEKGRNAIAAFLIKTEPGETSQARIRGTIVGTPECVLAGEASAYMMAAGSGADAAVAVASVDEADVALMQSMVAPKLALIQGLLELNPKLTPAIKFIILLSDFGDAPDSTNHFPGVNMDAYPGVVAHFPTVFDAATGTPPGPKHRNGRPLHLGSLVSAELAVDAGVLKNIDPPNDNADLDVRDDGIDTDPNKLSFQHCIATSIDVEVTLTQVAIDHFAKTDSHAYLNIWLDGDHDGDWEDELLCDGLTAREHIVIDQTINPSTAGTINLTIPTGNIPVPQGGENETMWLRATLSDEPSVKIDPSNSYGDGRGPAGGLRWGETEDYLYVPDATVAAPGGFGPDLHVTAESSLQTDFLAGDISAAGTSKIAGRTFLKLQIRSRGDRLAPNATLEIKMDPHGGVPPIIGTSWTGCLTCTVAAGNVSQIDLAADAASQQLPIEEVCDGSGCRLVINLGDVRPGEGGSILLGWLDSTAQTKDIQFKASVISTGDVDGTNNESFTTAKRLRREPTIVSPMPGTLGWTGCLTCTKVFRGFGEPNSTLTLFSDGFESGNTLTVKTDKDGFWKKEARLVDGTHEVRIMFETVAAADAEEANFNIGMPPTILNVDSSLTWDPTSFGMRKYGNAALQAAAIAEGDDSCGPWQFLDDAGRADLNGWKIPIRLDGEHELGMKALCNNEVSVSLSWGDASSVVFKDEDGDGRYTASLTGQDVFFTMPEVGDEVVATLRVTCGEDEASYSGLLVPIFPDKVVNAETGDPLENVEVTLWQRSSDPGAFRTLAPWEAQAFGQTNPQQTDSQGEFSFITPPGGYGLTAQIDGFQPLRAETSRRADVFVPGRTYAMTPVQPTGNVVQVRITPDGFDPPHLEIEPGTTVAWLNSELNVAQVETAIPAVAASATSKTWDSGLLSTGQDYQQTFGDEGSFSYFNSEDPSSQATIVVKAKEPEANGVKIYLPVIVR